MLILCFDFGMKYIGVAVGQQITNTTNSLPAIAAKDGIPIAGSIEKLISEWQPAIIIVGNPLALDGSMQDITLCARKFAMRLKNKYKIPVHLIDERYTTKEAKKITDYHSEKDYFAAVNSKAAELILQRWLELAN
jgi:putative Holliday junction resolvase